MANIPPRGRNEPAEAYLDRIIPELRKALDAVMPGASNTAVDGAGNLYVSPTIPAGSVPKLTVAPKIVKIDSENLVAGAVTLEATDIPDMVLAKKVIAGDVVTLSLLAGEIEAVEARIDNLTVNDANIANLSASKITAGDIAVQLNLYAANIFGGKMEITGASSKLLALQSTVSDYVIAVDQRHGSGGGISVIIPSGYATAGNAVDVQMRGSGNGIAVRAYNTATGVLAVADGDNAIQGECTGSSYAGVRGVGGQYGVHGSASGTGYGVYGTGSGASGAGVRGENSSTGPGVYGEASSGVGVNGASSFGVGVAGATSSGTGIEARASSGQALYAAKSGSSGTTSEIEASSGSYAGNIMIARCGRSASSSYIFLNCVSAGGESEIILGGDGTIAYDGALATPADYAEFFETVDGGPVPIGSSVMLVGSKVRAATVEDDPDDIIGVVRPLGASTIVGNSAWSGWSRKHLTDDYGAPLLDAEGNRVLNPDFDPSLPYSPRAERPEWVIVGLVGQVAVARGQPVNPRWRKMDDIGPAVERWFIR